MKENMEKVNCPLRRGLRKSCPNAEFFWFIFSLTWTEFRDLLPKISVLSPYTGKYGPEKLGIWTLFTQ